MLRPHRCLFLSVAASLFLLTACGSKEDPGTSVRVALTYDTSVGLDTVDVTAGADTVNAPISPELLLLLPDDAADTDMPIEVWARANGKLAAYGTTSVTPIRGSTVNATLSLTTCSPGCGANDSLTTCTGPAVKCALGCSSDGDAHCVLPKLSNGIDPALVDHARDIDLAEDTLFDVDTGEIIGGIARGKGEGTLAGITYAQMPAPANGVPLAVFAFRNLTVQSLATVQFTGSRAVVLLVGETATVAGTIDLAALKFEPGAGGGIGATATMAAQGCGTGGDGKSGTVNADGGGGGGGGGAMGAIGGTGATSGDTGIGGTAGTACLASDLQPLRGGSGGGRGPHFKDTTNLGGEGGGGGGALQLSALRQLVVSGTIGAGGGGGGAGYKQPANTTIGAGAGGGGGAGGALLLEAPDLILSDVAILAANGGGGGGAGVDGVNGEPGANAGVSTTRAAGGAGAPSSTPPSGGAGGVGSVSAAPGVSTSVANAGGGGGGVGVIVLRGRTRSIAATTSPAPSELDIQAQ